MGYLVSFAAIRGLEHTDRLHEIDKSIPWRAYLLPKTDITLVEWLRHPNPNNPSQNETRFSSEPCFCHRPSGVAFADRFGGKAAPLDQFYTELIRLKRASTFPKVAVHVGLLLNKLTKCDVLVIMSDDDGWDFGCEVSDGNITKLCFDAGDDEIIELGDTGQPLVTRVMRDPKLLHEIGRRISGSWAKRLETMFGFDANLKQLGLIMMDSSQSPPSQSIFPAPTKPFWKLW